MTSEQTNKEKDCTTCRYFLGCECFDGKVCDLYEEKPTSIEHKDFIMNRFMRCE